MRKKHFLIIGGTRGIGKEIVKNLQIKNYTISVVGRTLPSPHNKSNKNVHYWSTDLSDEKNISKTIDAIRKKNGNISHLIFCQRYRGKEDDWNGELNVSLTATKTIIERTTHHFDDTDEKSIVIIDSLSGYLIGVEQPLSYHVGKAGLRQLARYYAVVLGPKGIRVNCISPCTILKAESKHFYLHNTKLMNLYKHIIPLGRMGTAKDISDIVEFLCSPSSSFITGQNIIADGGLSLLSQDTLARDLGQIKKS